MCYTSDVNASDKKTIHGAAILLLGGSGERYQSDLPKQFVEMGGKPLFLYAYETLEASNDIDAVLLVVKKGYEDLASTLLKGHSKLLGIVTGGHSREESTYLGLKALENYGANPYTKVYIHDADRPLLTESLIGRLSQEVDRSLFAVPALPVSDSLAYAPDGKRIEHYGDRRGNVTLQTPQAAVYALFLKAFEEKKDELSSYHDDASVVLSALGLHPAIIRGEEANIKVNDRAGELFFLRLVKGEKR